MIIASDLSSSSIADINYDSCGTAWTTCLEVEQVVLGQTPNGVLVVDEDMCNSQDFQTWTRAESHDVVGRDRRGHRAADMASTTYDDMDQPP